MPPIARARQIQALIGAATVLLDDSSSEAREGLPAVLWAAQEAAEQICRDLDRPDMLLPDNVQRAMLRHQWLDHLNTTDRQIAAVLARFEERDPALVAEIRRAVSDELLSNVMGAQA